MSSSTVVMQRQSQARPALASFFIPGLGQLIQGRIFSALAWFTIVFLSALSVFLVIGFILWPLMAILCVVDAAKYQPKVMRVRA